jgi:hypothetical protein
MSVPPPNQPTNQQTSQPTAGYRLEPSEVEVLISEVAPGGGGTMSQSQFIASQVRTFTLYY